MNVATKLMAIELYTLGRDLNLSYEQMKEAFVKYADSVADIDKDSMYVQLELEL